jgi:hypothetical protein
MLMSVISALLHICVLNDSLHEELKDSLMTYLRHHSGSCYKFAHIPPVANQPAGAAA